MIYLISGLRRRDFKLFFWIRLAEMIPKAVYPQTHFPFALATIISLLRSDSGVLIFRLSADTVQ